MSDDLGLSEFFNGMMVIGCLIIPLFVSTPAQAQCEEDRAMYEQFLEEIKILESDGGPDTSEEFELLIQLKRSIWILDDKFKYNYCTSTSTEN